MSNRLTRLNLRRLVTCVMRDVGLTQRDCEYVQRRLKSEGVRFLTVTLPRLSKQVVRGLETGVFERADQQNSLTCFAWQKRSLRNFRSLLDQIFDASTGRLVATPSAAAIQGLRQFCEYFYKLALSFEPEELAAAEKKYMNTERELASTSFDFAWAERLRRAFETYYPQISRAQVHEVFTANRPRDGSGSFGLPGIVSGHDRPHRSPRWYVLRTRPDYEVGTCDRSYKPFSGFFKPYPSVRGVTISTSGNARECEVKFVPKDSRGPRVISKEPFHHLKAQMAYFDWITPLLERTTSGAVQFSDQQRFQEMAKAASIDRSMSTLDLKDASDLVRYDLVKHIFSQSPACRWFVTNSRSLFAKLPSGNKLSLKKLAGMGSGLTFPTMALLIHLSICVAVTTRTGLPYKSVMRAVHVYGDDVIVPTKWYDIAVSALRASGLCVNMEKSFHKGLFRESCGGDYYDGKDVAPIRLKLSGAGLDEPRKYSGLYLDVAEHGALQIERHCRELVKAHMYNTYEYLYSALEKCYGKLPSVSGESPVLGRYTENPEEIVFDSPIKAFVPKARHVYDALMCPYKTLRNFFKSVEVSLGQSFGDISLPRTIDLKYRLVYGSTLRGRVQEF